MLSVQDSIDGFLWSLLLNLVLALFLAIACLVEGVRREARRRGVKWWQL